MDRSFYKTILIFLLLAHGAQLASAADCQTATVGSPWSTCFDIYSHANITQAQFTSFNPGLNCSLLQVGQKVCISSGTLPSNAPKPQPDGTCAVYTTISGDFCAAIATKFSITVAQIETWNANTYKWKGCANLQVGFTMCVSTGKPPPIPVNPLLQCGPESAGNKTCPLKVCCSAFGFCGITDAFCTTTGANPCISNCFQPTMPSCSAGRTMRRMGYYAGWGNRRKNCPSANVAPDMVNLNGYTHVLFAFAGITQDYKIVVSGEDATLLKSLVGQKSKYNGLKVLIAVGGWDFSELNPTKDLFTLMISTSSNRAPFINSVKAFLTSYALDGIDIDFEYPGAIERNAPAEDTPNLTAFFKELRTGLGSAIISVATPAGYWFLRGFEIDKIADQVTFLNMMSYDYHGQWDTNVTGQDPVANPHTSIQDMRDSVLLYTRAGLDMGKVNLGLAWYARTYHLANPSCSGYGCTMTGGGAPGMCTGASGYLAQLEVLELMSRGVDARFDSTSQTYWFQSGGDLISFDQADTWQAKVEFAGSACFGGTFIWSLDQNQPNGVSDPSKPIPSYSIVPWNPNPYPPPGAVSETFVQSAGTFTTTGISVVAGGTQVVTRTVTIPASVETIIGSTVSAGTTVRKTSTSIHPSSVIKTTITQTRTSTITTTSAGVKTQTTVTIPIPTSTTSITIGGIIITLQPGGTPINAPLPTFISEVSGIIPTWTLNILPPPGATVVTFTAPLTSTTTWASTVTIPPSSDSPRQTVSGPPGDKNRCNNDNFFFLLFGGLINPCSPIDIGIIGGVTPTPIKPPGWTAPWPNPLPLPTGPPGGSPTGTQTSSSSTSTTSSSSACRIKPTSGYSIPPEDTAWDQHGTDPDQLRRRRLDESKPNDSEFRPKRSYQRLVKRIDPRHIQVDGCPGARVTSPSFISLTAGTYYTVDRSNFISTLLTSQQVTGRPADDTAQEHVFELGYFMQFFRDAPMNGADCNWIMDNIFNFQSFGTNSVAQAILAEIDRTGNMVWVDVPMNQAKSNIVNRNSGVPQQVAFDIIGDFTQDDNLIYDLEWYLRNFAALGSYFAQTSGTFRATADRFQLLLAQVTPNRVFDKDISLPGMFNEWLDNLLQSYPNSVVSRANSAWTYYRSRMAQTSLVTGIIPTCFDLYRYGIYNPSSFNYQNLLPPLPTLPKCNVPGVKGYTGYIPFPPTTPVTPIHIPGFPEQKIMGSGRLDYYGIGSGTGFRGTHWQGEDLSGRFANCNNAYYIRDLPNNSGADVLVNFNCGGLTGLLNAPISFIINNNNVKCVVVRLDTASSQRYDMICGPPNSVVSCASNYGIQGASNMGVTDEPWQFFPS